VHEFDAGDTVPKRIPTSERAEVPPRAEFGGIRLQSAAAARAGEARVGPPGAEYGS
jgi:hypothetical protein